MVLKEIHKSGNAYTNEEKCNFVKETATELALDAGLSTLANMVLIGKVIKETGLYTMDEIKLGLEKSIPPSKAALFDKNVKAVEIGFNYEG